jgi:HEPN domain-containing protein
MAKRLDLYFISARYPDAFPSGAPFEFFTRDQAEEAVSFAEKIVESVRSRTAGEQRSES